MFAARVVADSVNPNDERLTTLEVTYPRFILAEFNTHKRFSRNTASTRAIPLKKQIENIRRHPFVPERFPKNQSGMHNSEWLTGDEALRARMLWLDAADAAVNYASQLGDLEVHKQIAGRILEPFMWVTQVITSAFWDNFYDQRISEFAQPEIMLIASLMQIEMNKSEPVKLKWGAWHLPYVSAEEARESNAPDLSVARCAATSYNRQNTKAEIQRELERTAGLQDKKHWSPFEHQARADNAASYNPNFSGNFFGADWFQHRKMFDGESGESR